MNPSVAPPAQTHAKAVSAANADVIKGISKFSKVKEIALDDEHSVALYNGSSNKFPDLDIAGMGIFQRFHAISLNGKHLSVGRLVKYGDSNMFVTLISSTLSDGEQVRYRIYLFPADLFDVTDPNILCYNTDGNVIWKLFEFDLVTNCVVDFFDSAHDYVVNDSKDADKLKKVVKWFYTTGTFENKRFKSFETNPIPTETLVAVNEKITIARLKKTATRKSSGSMKIGSAQITTARVLPVPLVVIEVPPATQSVPHHDRAELTSLAERLRIMTLDREKWKKDFGNQGRRLKNLQDKTQENIDKAVASEKLKVETLSNSKKEAEDKLKELTKKFNKLEKEKIGLENAIEKEKSKSIEPPFPGPGKVSSSDGHGNLTRSGKSRRMDRSFQNDDSFENKPPIKKGVKNRNNSKSLKSKDVNNDSVEDNIDISPIKGPDTAILDDEKFARALQLKLNEMMDARFSQLPSVPQSLNFASTAQVFTGNSSVYQGHHTASSVTAKQPSTGGSHQFPPQEADATNINRQLGRRPAEPFDQSSNFQGQSSQYHHHGVSPPADVPQSHHYLNTFHRLPSKNDASQSRYYSGDRDDATFAALSSQVNQFVDHRRTNPPDNDSQSHYYSDKYNRAPPAMSQPEPRYYATRPPVEMSHSQYHPSNYRGASPSDESAQSYYRPSMNSGAPHTVNSSSVSYRFNN